MLGVKTTTYQSNIFQSIMILGVTKSKYHTLSPTSIISHNTIQSVAIHLLVTNSATAYRPVRSYLIVGKYLNILTEDV